MASDQLAADHRLGDRGQGSGLVVGRFVSVVKEALVPVAVSLREWPGPAIKNACRVRQTFYFCDLRIV